MTIEPPSQGPVSLYGSVQFDMPSASSGRTYRIFVFRPPVPPPPSGYPVIVTTDGNLSFPIAATLGAAFLFGGKAALVVGVGYATDDPFELLRLRTRDLTPPTPRSAITQNPLLPPVKHEDYGGSDNFYRFLVDELRPAIAGAYPVNSEDQTLYGHSWGGLFALGVLFNHPKSFRNFVASSPSIWWNERALLKDEPDFTRKLREGDAAPRVLITVGSLEQDVPETLPPNITRTQMHELIAGYRMVDNARELALRLQQIKGGDDYLVRFQVFEDESHLSVLSASIGRALGFALGPT
jgi:predicted alpha/beta superfamily hydrolase